MNDKATTFWSRATRSLATRLPPWQIVALVVGHVILHVGINLLWRRDWRDEPPTKELILVPLCLCQISLLVVWLALGRTPGPIRFLAICLVTFVLWTPRRAGIGPDFPLIVFSLFWPWHPDLSDIEMYFGLGAYEVVMLSLAGIMQLVVLGTPLAILRLAGLRLAIASETTNPTCGRWQFSIARLLLWTAAAAVGLAVARLIYFDPFWNLRPRMDVLLPQSLKWGAVTLPAVACALYSTLGTRLNFARLAALILLSFLLSAVWWWVIDGPDSPTDPYGFEWPVAALWYGPPVFTLVPFVSLLVVRSAGYRLTWRSST